MSLLKKKNQLIALALSALLAAGSGVTVLSATQTVSAATEKGSITLDTANYTMAPGNCYDIGAFIKDMSGKQLSAAQVQSLVTQGKLRVSDSRTGSVVNLQQLSSGHFRVTGKKVGTCYIVYEIGGNHASVRIDVKNGVKQHGSAVRNTSYFSNDILKNLSVTSAQYKIVRQDKSFYNGTNKFDFYYDQVILSGNTPGITSINAQIAKNCNDFLSDAKLKDLKEYQRFDTAKASVTYNANGIFSIRIWNMWLGAGVNGVPRNVTYDLNTGKVLGLGELLNQSESSLKERLRSIAKNYLNAEKANTKEGHRDKWPWVSDDYSYQKLTDFQFYISNGQVILDCAKDDYFDGSGSFISDIPTGLYIQGTK